MTTGTPYNSEVSHLVQFYSSRNNFVFYIKMLFPNLGKTIIKMEPIQEIANFLNKRGKTFEIVCLCRYSDGSAGQGFRVPPSQFSNSTSQSFSPLQMPSLTSDRLFRKTRATELRARWNLWRRGGRRRSGHPSQKCLQTANSSSNDWQR